jgi:hypothetical protein
MISPSASVTDAASIAAKMQLVTLTELPAQADSVVTLAPASTDKSLVSPEPDMHAQIGEILNVAARHIFTSQDSWKESCYAQARNHLVEPVIKLAVFLFEKTRSVEERALFHFLVGFYKKDIRYHKLFETQVVLGVQIGLLLRADIPTILEQIRKISADKVWELVRDFKKATFVDSVKESLEEKSGIAVHTLRETAECKESSTDDPLQIKRIHELISDGLQNVLKQNDPAFQLEENCDSLVRQKQSLPIVELAVNLYEKNISSDERHLFKYLVKKCKEKKPEIEELGIKLGLLLKLHISTLLERIIMFSPNWKKHLIL